MKEYPSKKPKLEQNQRMMIGAYWCPIPTDKAYKNIAECGITHMYVNTMIGHEKDDEGYYLRPFALAKKYGIKILMHCMDNGYANIKEYTEIFKQKDNFEGVIAKDEPSIKFYDFYAKDYQEYKKQFPNSLYLINLLPNYADETQMGTKDYGEYLTQYTEKVLKKYEDGNRVLMCDSYPLKIHKKIYPLWLKNIEDLREIATETKSDLYLFLQSQGFLTNWRQPTCVAELSYQMYVYLAYGARGLAHYPYRMPMDAKPYERSCVTYHNRKTYMFDLVRQMNALLKKIDSVYMGFNHKGVIATVGKNNKENRNENFDNCKKFIKNYGVLKGVKSEYDVITGCFTNKEDYQGFMVVNFNEPLENVVNKVELELDGINNAICYIKGEKKELKVKNGKLSLQLGAGEGVFVIPYNE